MPPRKASNERSGAAPAARTRGADDRGSADRRPARRGRVAAAADPGATRFARRSAEDIRGAYRELRQGASVVRTRQGTRNDTDRDSDPDGDPSTWRPPRGGAKRNRTADPGRRAGQGRRGLA